MSSEVSLLFPLHYTGAHLKFTQYTVVHDGYGNDTLMQSGPGLFRLIKKASYLADKGQVTFGRDFKHFPLLWFEASGMEKKERALLWAYQRNSAGEERGVG